MRLEITHESIAQGGHSQTDCPLQRAMESAGYHGAHVRQSTVVLGDRRSYEWPSEVRDWIRAYDLHQSVLPVVFEFNWKEKP